MEISFKARNPNIREAQKVCRMIRTNFDYISPTKIEKEMPIASYYDSKFTSFIEKKKNLNKESRIDRFFMKSIYKKYQEILRNAIQNKIANCYELSAITEIALKMNGIKNCAKASITTQSGKTIDHCVTCIFPKNPNDKKKIIIIDPLFQECGYINEMLTKYKHKYKQYFEKMKPTDELIIKPKDEKTLSASEIKKLTDKFKQLKKITIQKSAFD